MTLTQTLTQELTTQTFLTTFTKYLKKWKFIEVGKILNILDDGKSALVEYCDGTKHQIQAELIGIGSFSSTLSSVQAGQYCIILFPFSSFNLAQQLLDVASPNYAETYAKILPIGIPTNTSAQIAMDENGFHIQGIDYGVSFEKSLIKFESPKQIIQYDFTKNELSIYNVSGKVWLRFNAQGIQITAGYDESSHTSKTTIQITPDGAINMQVDSLQIEAKNEVELKSEKIKLDADVTITGSLDVADGNFTVDKSII